MNWQMIRDWLLEAEIITEEQAHRLTEVAEQKAREQDYADTRRFEANRTAYDALPWWRKLGGYRWSKDYRR